MSDQKDEQKSNIQKGRLSEGYSPEKKTLDFTEPPKGKSGLTSNHTQNEKEKNDRKK